MLLRCVSSYWDRKGGKERLKTEKGEGEVVGGTTNQSDMVQWTVTILKYIKHLQFCLICEHFLEHEWFVRVVT